MTPIYSLRNQGTQESHSREAEEAALELGLCVIFTVAGEIQEGIFKV